MQIVIICLEASLKNNNFQGLSASDAHVWLDGVIKSEQEQTLSLTRTIARKNDLPPIVVCQKNSVLADSLEPELRQVVSNPPGLVDLWKIWRWQKKQEQLAILAVGAQSLRVATRLERMHRKARVWAAFFTQPPVMLKKGLHRFICGSNFIADQVRELFDARNKELSCGGHIIMPGLEIENWLERPARNSQRFIFGMAGSLLPKSGALMTVRAMSALWQHENLPDWELRMFGSGSRLAEILSEAETLGVASRLSLLHEQRLCETAPLCDAWLAPGSSPEEQPEVLDAGFAAGIPVICSRSALHSERLEKAPAETVLMIDNSNPQELAKAMLAVLRDADLKNALAQASKNFSSQISASAASEAIYTLLAQEQDTPSQIP